MAVPKMVYLFNAEGRPFTLGKCLLDEMHCPGNVLEHACIEIIGASGCKLRIDPGNDGVPLAHSVDCPCRRFCSEYHISFQHSTRVEVGVQALVESSDGQFLIVRQDLHLMQFPKAWGTLGGLLLPGESMEQVIARKLDNVGVKVTCPDGRVRYMNESCGCVPFFMFENVYPVTLELGLPVMQQLMVFYHVQLPAPARHVKLTTKGEVDIALWLSGSDLSEVRAGFPTGEHEGIWKQNKACRVSNVQLIDFAPNKVGEGFARSSWAAVWHWLDSRSE